MSAERVAIEDVGWQDLLSLDSYRQNTGTPAAVQLWLNPTERLARLENFSPGQAIPEEEWNQKIVTILVESDEGAVDGPATVEWLRGEELQHLLERVCAGHDVRWNGNNWVGVLNEDAQEAKTILETRLLNAPGFDGEILSAGDWLCAGQSRDAVREEYGISSRTADAELRDIEKSIEEEAMEQLIVLYGTSEFLEELREEVREEEEEEE